MYGDIFVHDKRFLCVEHQGIIMPALSDLEIREKLKSLNKWGLFEGALVKRFEFSGFKEAMDFVNKAAAIAEEMDHHPDIFISYNKVYFKLMTHSENGLTEKDFELASKIDVSV